MIPAGAISPVCNWKTVCLVEGNSPFGLLLVGSAASADLLFAGGRIYAIFIAQELCRYYVVCMQCSYVCMYLTFHSSLPLFEIATRNPLITLDIMVQESFKALP